MAVSMLHGNTEPNFAVKEDSVTVIGKAIPARDYASKKDRARAAYQQKDCQYKKMNYTTDGPIIIIFGPIIIIFGCFEQEPPINAKFNKHESIDTNCAIYNATDGPIIIILGRFEHTNRPKVPEGSEAAVVYRIKNANAQGSDWMSARDNPRVKDQYSGNHVYPEIGEVGHFNDEIWPKINEKLKTAGPESNDTKNGCLAEVTITEGSPAYFVAVTTLEI